MYPEFRTIVQCWPRPTSIPHIDVQLLAQCVSLKKQVGKNIRKEIGRHWASFSKDSPNNSVNEKWLRLKSILINCLNKFVPTKLPSKRRNLPWLDKSLRKAIRKKARLYNRAKTSKRPDLWAKYKLQKRETQRNLRRARWTLVLY